MGKRNWYKFGRDIATGKKGTGWMQADKSMIEEVLTKVDPKKQSIYEALYDNARKWEETEQFQYEVGQYMPAMKNESSLLARFETEHEFFLGYTDVLFEMYKKLYAKKSKKAKK